MVKETNKELKNENERRNEMEKENQTQNELVQELIHRFNIVNKEVGHDIELKKQVVYNTFYEMVLKLEKEFENEKELEVIQEIIDDYENNNITDVRSVYFNYIYSTDTELIY